MSIRLRCPNCNKKLRGDDSMLGRRIRCPKCKKKIQINLVVSSDEESPTTNTEGENADSDEKDRPSWFEWMFKGLPAEFRVVRRRADEKLAQLQFISSELHDLKERSELDVDRAIGELIDQKVDDQLEATPVERLSEITQSVRVKALTRHGYQPWRFVSWNTPLYVA